MATDVSATSPAGLTASEQEWISRLRSADYDQYHLCPENASPENLRRIVGAAKRFDETYPGGLLNYLKRARKLMLESRDGVNPLEGYIPEVPEGASLKVGTPEFYEMEELGFQNIHKVAFVLVAGGLGERLGYPGIKLGLPVETVTSTCYLEYYIRFIRSAGEMVKQRRIAEYREAHPHGPLPDMRCPELPLTIMTSDDTHDKTLRLLQTNSYFGLNDKLVRLVKQQKVPALVDFSGKIATKPEDPFSIESKPHGHGDVHTLLAQHRLPETWLGNRLEYVFMFQDTNALALRALCPLLGVMIKESLVMNSLTVPRKPGEALGAICLLKPADTKRNLPPLTLNVEYNQLEPLLKNTGFGGDVAADPANPFSRFPGNANVLLFNLQRYSEVLKASGGTVPEFVNPKFAPDGSFKTPTRLECLMQEFPRLLTKPTDKVGATVIDRWFCFSTVKNNVVDAVLKASKNLAPEAALSGEADQYAANVKMLEIVMSDSSKGKTAAPRSAQLGKPINVTFNNLTYPVGPRLVIQPEFAFTMKQLADRFSECEAVKLESESVLLLDGSIKVKGSLEVDGAVIVAAKSPLQLMNLCIKNAGWQMVCCPDSSSDAVKVRGFVWTKTATCSLST